MLDLLVLRQGDVERLLVMEAPGGLGGDLDEGRSGAGGFRRKCGRSRIHLGKAVGRWVRDHFPGQGCILGRGALGTGPAVQRTDPAEQRSRHEDSGIPGDEAGEQKGHQTGAKPAVKGAGHHRYQECRASIRDRQPLQGVHQHERTADRKEGKPITQQTRRERQYRTRVGRPARHVEANPGDYALKSTVPGTGAQQRRMLRPGGASRRELALYFGNASVAELADAQDLGSCPVRGAGSTPAVRI